MKQSASLIGNPAARRRAFRLFALALTLLTLALALPAGAAAIASHGADVIPPPTISGVRPIAGPVGTVVTLSGSGFSGATVVELVHAEAVFTVLSDAQIRLIVPAGARSGRIGVTTPAGSAVSAAWFTVGPTLKSFTPASGPAGTLVTLTGINFTSTTRVAFNDVRATSVTVVSPAQITAVVPFAATTGPISVSSRAGSSFSADPFIVTAAPLITVTAPTGTGSYVRGSSLTVSWTIAPATAAGEFGLWARSPGGGLYIGKLVPASGAASYATSLTLDVPTGSGYQVIVAWRATAGSGAWTSFGTSPGSFAVTDKDVPGPGEVTEFAVSENSGPLDIVGGPDGNLYFSASTNHAIGLITTSGTVTLFGTMDDPNGLAFDGLGNLWFSMPYPSLYDLGMWALPLSTFTLPRYWDIPYPGEEGGRPAAMALGPDGCIWYTQPNMSRVGSVDPSGPATQTPASYLLSGGLAPKDITAGPDGGMWYTAAGSSQIGRLSTTGAQSYFTVVSSGPSNPVGIASGPDGNLWITNEGNNSIQQVTPSGVVATFAIPTAASGPMGIAAGPDGNLWFMENVANQIGRITTAGVITEYPIPSPTSNAIAITAGSDGNMWFTEEGDFTITDPTGDKIGRITTGMSATSGTPASSAAGQAGLPR